MRYVFRRKEVFEIVQAADAIFFRSFRISSLLLAQSEVFVPSTSSTPTVISSFCWITSMTSSSRSESVEETPLSVLVSSSRHLARQAAVPKIFLISRPLQMVSEAA